MFKFVSTDITSTAIIDTLDIKCTTTELFHRDGVKASKVIVTHTRKQKVFLAGLIVKGELYSPTEKEYQTLDNFYQPRENSRK